MTESSKVTSRVNGFAASWAGPQQMKVKSFLEPLPTRHDLYLPRISEIPSGPSSEKNSSEPP